MSCPSLVALLVTALAVLPIAARAADEPSPRYAGAAWQYYVPFDTGRAGKDGQVQPGKVFLWLPPQAKTIRGLLVGGQLGIELEIALDRSVRKACADSDVGIVYFVPHISGVFHYWQEGSTDAQRWLKAFDDLARRSGHPELRRVPWITMGHSTAGIFCRNVAYWKPQRVAGIIHIKSGNFHQKEHLPPNGSLAGVPLIAINGQFETFGPEGGIRPELGRETQWVCVRRDIEQFKEKDSNHLMSMWLDLGGDHFHGSPELSDCAALFIRKTAQYRIPSRLPDGDNEVPCIPLKLEDGCLTDPDLYKSASPPAAYKDYAGDKLKAMWHYDKETAEANAQHHRNIGAHQCLSNPVLTWLDEGDGWTFRATAEFLDVMPEKYGGSVGNRRLGRPKTPFAFRCKINEPVTQVAPDTFRVLRPVKAINIAAVHPGDDQYRATNRWGSIDVPTVKGQAQTIEFPPVPELKANSDAQTLQAKASSGLPVYYEVEYGPVVVKDGKLMIADLPDNAPFPIECTVTAYQIGRRVGAAVTPAQPVSVGFTVVRP
ncbi:MAG: hypothetical protein NTW87_34000 [Planctomycetota bacterium]|nr:hypothetical protein [Planctomycetota bacterium]